MDHNWDDLRVFLAVARDETLSAAGKRLKIDPATVGRRISRMEERYGTPLFAKSPFGYALTDAGSRLMPRSNSELFTFFADGWEFFHGLVAVCGRSLGLALADLSDLLNEPGST